MTMYYIPSYVYICFIFCVMLLDDFSSLLMPFFPAMHIMSTTCFIGFSDGASHRTQKLASSTWALYTLTYSLLWQVVVCIGPATNNQFEYAVVAGLLADVVRKGIRNLQGNLDSQLIVEQLNGFYTICNAILRRRYLQVCLLC